MEQTNGFQSFRTRSFLRENGKVSMVLESECFHGVGAFEVLLLKVSALPSPKRLRAGRSKVFSPVCLFLFSELQPLFPIATQSLEGEDGVEGSFSDGIDKLEQTG